MSRCIKRDFVCKYDSFIIFRSFWCVFNIFVSRVYSVLHVKMLHKFMWFVLKRLSKSEKIVVIRKNCGQLLIACNDNLITIKIGLRSSQQFLTDYIFVRLIPSEFYAMQKCHYFSIKIGKFGHTKFVIFHVMAILLKMWLVQIIWNMVKLSTNVTVQVLVIMYVFYDTPFTEIRLFHLQHFCLKHFRQQNIGPTEHSSNGTFV